MTEREFAQLVGAVNALTEQLDTQDDTIERLSARVRSLEIANLTRPLPLDAA